MQLFLLKRGGEEIYVGPLGHESTHLINYFEVIYSTEIITLYLNLFGRPAKHGLKMSTLKQSIQGINKITEGYNPATWMLEVSNTSQEAALGVDFAQLYKNSELYK